MMIDRKVKNIFLIGPMAAGKTSIGRVLARNLGWEFYDSDQVVEQQAGVDIVWIFDEEGEEGFRRREQNVIHQLTQKRHVVLSTGGGSVANAANRNALEMNGHIVWLQVSVDQQVKRTVYDRKRPAIQNADRKSVFTALQRERQVWYEELADVAVRTDQRRVYTVVEDIITQLNQSVLAVV